RGVVPIRFGADALGGAVNLVSTNASLRTGGAASYEVGSFGTYRAALTGRFRDPGSGFTAGITAFLDHSANDYAVYVDVPDRRGRLHEMRVPRFHDAYTAFGGSAEVGFAGTSWARRLLLRFYGTGYRKELQHNIFMTVPYGEAEYGERVYGASLRYEQDRLFGANASIELLTSLGRRTMELYDMSRNRYGWDGRIVRQVPVPGEIHGPADDVYWEWTSFSRLLLRWAPAPEHELSATVTPTYSTRTGDDRLVDQTMTFDPLALSQDLTTVVSGLSYRLRLFDERLENELFGKHYFYHVRGEDLLAGDTVRTLTSDSMHWGVGEALRFRFEEWIWAKASYEYATRLPRPDELFGDGAFVLPNLELRPEESHNVNAGAQLDVRDEQSTGRWQAQVNLFARIYDHRIVAYSDANTTVYRNILSASTFGAEASIAWTSPGRYVSLQANGTIQDQRNTSSTGEFANYRGDRVPNVPWLFFNVAAQIRVPDVLAGGDAFVLGWDTRYVHEFFRTWESVGLGGGKDDHSRIPAQLVHGLHVSYQLPGPVRTSTTFEIRNLTDERVYDYVGVQRAGRSFHLKLTLHL
ncbi:MAG TPA: ligand-gated channel protein, partial [Sandaracinaceae bacterium]